APARDGGGAPLVRAEQAVHVGRRRRPGPRGRSARARGRAGTRHRSGDRAGGDTRMSNDFSPGLAGVVAFETEIAEPDKDGGELRYRGVNIEDLVGKVPFEQVWGLLVDESLHPGLPYEHVDLERRTGGYTADLQSTLAALSGEWKLGQFIDIDDEEAKEGLRPLSSGAT